MAISMFLKLFQETFMGKQRQASQSDRDTFLVNGYPKAARLWIVC